MKIHNPSESNVEETAWSPAVEAGATVEVSPVQATNMTKTWEFLSVIVEEPTSGLPEPEVVAPDAPVEVPVEASAEQPEAVATEPVVKKARKPKQS